jgi:hypothetical protein
MNTTHEVVYKNHHMDDFGNDLAKRKVQCMNTTKCTDIGDTMTVRKAAASLVKCPCLE